jgi:hypothetical protein
MQGAMEFSGYEAFTIRASLFTSQKAMCLNALFGQDGFEPGPPEVALLEPE